MPVTLKAQADSLKKMNSTKTCLDSLLFEVSTIYPNPVEDECFVDIKLNTQQLTTVKIFNLLGVSIIENFYILNIGVNKIRIDLSELKGGIYFLNVTLKNREGFVVTKKIIIK